jgi:hypothetical protein
MRLGSYRFFFYSAEGAEPPHIHVSEQGREAKFWLHDMSVARNRGFADHELNAIIRHISVYRMRLQAAWSEHFE